MIDLKEVSKVYQKGTDAETTALRNVTLHVEQGEFISVMGPSGSGKSTLMNLIGCMDSPTSGSITLDGHDISKAGVRKLHRLRSRYISFIFRISLLWTDIRQKKILRYL